VSRLPQHAHAEGAEHRVGRNKGDAFDLSLGSWAFACLIVNVAMHVMPVE